MFQNITGVYYVIQHVKMYEQFNFFFIFIFNTSGCQKKMSRYFIVKNDCFVSFSYFYKTTKLLDFGLITYLLPVKRVSTLKFGINCKSIINLNRSPYIHFYNF